MIVCCADVVVVVVVVVVMMRLCVSSPKKCSLLVRCYRVLLFKVNPRGTPKPGQKLKREENRWFLLGSTSDIKKQSLVSLNLYSGCVGVCLSKVW